MNRFVVSSLLLLASVAYACGPRARSADTERKKTVEGPPLATNLEVVKVQGGFQLKFRITNNEPRKLEFLFPSGQTHDFIVLDSLDREVWRWSEGRMFTQAVQNRLVESGGALLWEAAWQSAAPPGRYTAVASLLSENRPLEERVPFEIR